MHDKFGKPIAPDGDKDGLPVQGHASRQAGLNGPSSALNERAALPRNYHRRKNRCMRNAD
ncbi:hypothetical protein [Bradyrhizobium sp. Tv2a-2]|uniref:hypothetical protein n=1 Tax=Bradyrhizobium sp. Tv2a-2 TaxID=113395 RepID=UPI0004632F8F|nr:hypothetical protein [Bradyrhizobium sp. Tv2a-2]